MNQNKEKKTIVFVQCPLRNKRLFSLALALALFFGLSVLLSNERERKKGERQYIHTYSASE